MSTNQVREADPRSGTERSGNERADAHEGDTTSRIPAKPRRRGFAAMDRDRVREIASKGGRAAHAAGTAHQFNRDEARIAGKKGGMAPHARRGGARRPVPSENERPPPTGHERGTADRG